MRTTESIRYGCPFIDCIDADAADADAADADADAGVGANKDADMDAGVDEDTDDAGADVLASSSQANRRDVGGGRGSLSSLLAAAVVDSVSCWRDAAVAVAAALAAIAAVAGELLVFFFL